MNWAGRTPYTQIVVIGAAGGIDGAVLRNQFQKVVAPNQALQAAALSKSSICRIR
jgi:hypothetical protein